MKSCLMKLMLGLSLFLLTPLQAMSQDGYIWSCPTDSNLVCFTPNAVRVFWKWHQETEALRRLNASLYAQLEQYQKMELEARRIFRLQVTDLDLCEMKNQHQASRIELKDREILDLKSSNKSLKTQRDVGLVFFLLLTGALIVF